MAFEKIILDFFQNMRSPFTDTLMKFFSKTGDGGILWISLSLVLMLFPRTRKTGYTLAMALFLEFLLCNCIIKPLVGRLRPFERYSFDMLLIAAPEDFSFPSGHTASSFASAAALNYRKSPLSLPAWILAALIAFSRMYLYVHFPTDIMAGIVLGIGVGVFAGFLCDKIEKRVEVRKETRG